MTTPSHEVWFYGALICAVFSLGYLLAFCHPSLPHCDEAMIVGYILAALSQVQLAISAVNR